MASRNLCPDDEPVAVCFDCEFETWDEQHAEAHEGRTGHLMGYAHG